MTDDGDDLADLGGFASPPCYAAEIAPDYFDPLGVDPAQARDVARWRQAERRRLRAESAQLSHAVRHSAEATLTAHLRSLLSERFGPLLGRSVAGYWPTGGEPDLHPLLAELHEAGVTIALPVAGTPPAFRRWTPGAQMAAGAWNIPEPPPEAPELEPAILLVPLVGWTMDGDRLGHGGAYYDRVLALRAPRPFTIGIGFEHARLATIYPQPHDIPLDVILTEEGVRRDGRVKPYPR